MVQHHMMTQSSQMEPWMPYRSRMLERMLMPMAGALKKHVVSSMGRQQHSPNFDAVLQVKHGKHQKAKQQDSQSLQQSHTLEFHVLVVSVVLIIVCCTVDWPITIVGIGWAVTTGCL